MRNTRLIGQFEHGFVIARRLMKSQFSNRPWSKLGGKFKWTIDSTHRWIRKGAQVSRSNVLVWQDASGDIWLSCNHPIWLAKRQGLGQEAETTVNAQTAALEE